MKHRTRSARLLVPFVSAVLLMPAAYGVAAAGECSPGDYDYYISTYAKDVLMTKNYIWATLGPGGSASKTLTTGTTTTSTVTVSGSATFSAGVILAQAETKVGFELADAGQRTQTTSVTISQTNNTTTTHRYVFFEGTRRGNGTWRSNKCIVGTMKPYATGNWGSFEGQVHGVLRCDQDSTIASLYGTGSVEYKAVTSCT